jgi:hypothetical protein
MILNQTTNCRAGASPAPATELRQAVRLPYNNDQRFALTKTKQ